MRFVLLCSMLASCGTETSFRSRAETPRAPRGETSGDDPDEPHRSCAGAISEEITLSFPARANCAFSQDGNLGQRNEFLQARAEATGSVALPEGSRLCELSLASRGERASFDDHLALLVDDVVVVSGGSGGALDEHPVRGGFPRFDWPGIRGRPFADRYTPYECLGTGVCVVPRTEESGPLDVQIDPETMTDLVDALALDAGFDVTIVVFGDDDWGDCAHSDLTLDVTVRYVP